MQDYRAAMHNIVRCLCYFVKPLQTTQHVFFDLHCVICTPNFVLNLVTCGQNLANVTTFWTQTDLWLILTMYHSNLSSFIQM